MAKRIPNEKKIMREMAEIAFSDEEKTADRLRAMDMLSSMVEKQGKSDDAFARLDAILASLAE